MSNALLMSGLLVSGLLATMCGLMSNGLLMSGLLMSGLQHRMAKALHHRMSGLLMMAKALHHRMAKALSPKRKCEEDSTERISFRSIVGPQGQRAGAGPKGIRHSTRRAPNCPTPEALAGVAALYIAGVQLCLLHALILVAGVAALWQLNAVVQRRSCFNVCV